MKLERQWAQVTVTELHHYFVFFFLLLLMLGFLFAVRVGVCFSIYLITVTKLMKLERQWAQVTVTELHHYFVFFFLLLLMLGFLFAGLSQHCKVINYYYVVLFVAIPLTGQVRKLDDKIEWKGYV